MRRPSAHLGHTDFGTLLALSGDDWPSVLLLRGRGRTRPDRVPLILQALTAARDEIASGAMVVLDGDRLRVRMLPIRPQTPIAEAETSGRAGPGPEVTEL